MLFRGINVGGKNILPMKDLVNILEAMDYSKVRTYIQSGNAVFCSKKKCNKNTAREIGSKIHKNHGFEPKVLLLGVADLEKSIDENPFDEADGKSVHFYFLETRPEKPDLEKIQSLKAESEEYRLLDRVYYLYAPDGIGRSKLASAVEKHLGVTTTARNLNTVRKLAALANQ